MLLSASASLAFKKLIKKERSITHLSPQPTLKHFHYPEKKSCPRKEVLYLSHSNTYRFMCVCLVTQLHPTRCGPMDYSLPGSSAHGILQARILEWVAISFSRDLPGPGIKPTTLTSPALAADSLPLCHLGSTCRFSLFFSTAAKLLQSCLTLCYPIDGSPPGSPVSGFLQARTLEWVAISFSISTAR